MGHTLNASNGATYKVVKLLSRPGGTVDLIVGYSRRGRRPTYTAYRYEPDGVWKCLNGAWMSSEVAIEEVARMDRYAPLVSPELRAFLAAAIGLSDSEMDASRGAFLAEHADKPTVGGGPELPGFIEDEFERLKDEP